MFINPPTKVCPFPHLFSSMHKSEWIYISLGHFGLLLLQQIDSKCLKLWRKMDHHRLFRIAPRAAKEIRKKSVSSLPLCYWNRIKDHRRVPDITDFPLFSYFIIDAIYDQGIDSPWHPPGQSRKNHPSFDKLCWRDRGTISREARPIHPFTRKSVERQVFGSLDRCEVSIRGWNPQSLESDDWVSRSPLQIIINSQPLWICISSDTTGAQKDLWYSAIPGGSDQLSSASFFGSFSPPRFSSRSTFIHVSQPIE